MLFGHPLMFWLAVLVSVGAAVVVLIGVGYLLGIRMAERTRQGGVR